MRLLTQGASTTIRGYRGEPRGVALTAFPVCTSDGFLHPNRSARIPLTLGRGCVDIHRRYKYSTIACSPRQPITPRSRPWLRFPPCGPGTESTGGLLCGVRANVPVLSHGSTRHMRVRLSRACTTFCLWDSQTQKRVVVAFGQIYTTSSIG